MGGFAITIKGAQEVEQKLATLAANVAPAVAIALQQGALLVQSSAIESIQHGSATGRTYKTHGIEHVASAPGMPPATDTGALASSIEIMTSDDGLSVAIGSNLDYASYLEYGTRDMQPRPFLNPALDVNTNEILSLVTNAANSAIKEGSNGSSNGGSTTSGPIGNI